MKGMKGKLLKKLKSIKPIVSLNQDRVLQVKALDGYVDFLPKISSFNLSNPFVSRENKSKKIVQSSDISQEENEKESIGVSEIIMDFDEFCSINKENIGPCSSISKPQVSQIENRDEAESKHSGNREEAESKQSEDFKEKRSHGNNNDRKRKTPMPEIDIKSFRKPDLDSGSLFDPNLLAAFNRAVEEHSRITGEQSMNRIEDLPWEIEEEEEEEDEEDDPLILFEEKCPPGGDGTVILYTTSLRGIRKTFEDCNKVRFLLDSSKVLYFERDISMDKGYRDELWSILEGKELPPRLFVKGRYIGGVDEVLSLHEQGKLKQIFEGVPLDWSNGPCDACGGLRFIVCFKCNGNHKVFVGSENVEKNNQCPQCNENGLIVCAYCS